jgi:hypothetical protein
MHKRQFLASAVSALSAASLPAAAARPAPNAGPVLLTITGAIGKPNRGAFDPALDQMMAKQKLSFDKACALDFAAIAALPAVEIRPTLEYDGKAHTLRGPPLLDVLKVAGATPKDSGRLTLRAIDGFAAQIGVAQARSHRFIVATHLDGHPLGLGGLGPLWALYDADRVPDMAAKPVAERFGACPWGLYHIDVQA